MAEGHLRIKTKLDNSSLSKDIKNAQKELDRLKKEEEKLTSKNLEIEAKLHLDDSDYLKKRAEIERKRNIEIQANTVYSGNTPVIDSSKEQKINTKYDNQLANLGLKMDQSISRAEYEIEKNNEAIKKCQKSQEEWNQKIDDTKKKLQLTELNEVKDKVGNIGNSLTDVVKKVGKWALAVFGVRSAYNAVRGAASTLSQYNKQIGDDLNYIRFAIASAFQPIVEKLISLVYKLLAYVNYLAKAWFDVDLFGRATVKNFNKANSSAKKLKKTMSQFNFDDINKLEDHTSDDSNTDISTPSVDLSSQMNDIEIPEWLKDFADFCKPVINFFNDIIDKYGVVAGGIMIVVGAFVGFSILKKVIGWITGLGKASSGVSADFTGLLNSLGKAAEFIALLGGIALVIKSITDLIDTFSKSGMTLGTTAGLLGSTLGILAATFVVLLGAMTALKPGWESIAGAVVIFGGLALVIASVTKLIDTFSKSGLKLTDVIGLMATVLVTIVALMGSVALIGPMMSAGLGPFVVVIAAICATLLVMAKTLPIILEAAGKFINDIAPVIVTILKTIYSGIYSIIMAIGTVLPPIIQSIGLVFKTIFGGIAKIIETVGNSISKVMSTAGNVTITVLRAILNFINQLGPAINNFVNGAIKAVTKLINFMISGVEYMINTLIIGGINKLISQINKIPLVNVPKFGKVKIERFKPTYMKGGGIIDVPKRGVPLASDVVGGEAGAEGVLPLENPETMARLGKEIGQWITLNIDLTSKIDMRILAREVINYINENNFARNGGY